MVNWIKMMGLMIAARIEGQLSQQPEVALKKKFHTTVTNSIGWIQEAKPPAENVKS
jgi:hypothetical protein